MRTEVWNLVRNGRNKKLEEGTETFAPIQKQNKGMDVEITDKQQYVIVEKKYLVLEVLLSETQ